MDTVARVTVIYLVVLLGLRVLGKREFGQLSPLELVSLLMIPEIVSQALIGSDYSLTTGLTGLCTLLVLVFLTSLLVQRFERVGRLVSGDPTVLVYEGRFLVDAMNRMRVTPDEVFTEMHKTGLEALSEVKWAILEPDGSIAILAHDPPEHPSTPAHAERKKPV
ncbi:MAG: DUF421 domain-containing protein [Hydrogenophaga sp.]|uniref:DUF421 domain-containing protein n=1 Tax=Hydrogenophaga sp. TaxID=1904254 RepID=UPI0016931583|nr:YetF domain-containing protein [Hydrogenophaga sp.]NIM41133.1 DUF421 domain-containing protein [Hydrogenophaga sp.]NIN26449.1 DUF421 domain-containing protein [Hydrogenophaga sp.]NIN31324.1 DUF421 domain-containing protein [Hydrogenophaga sp.]NIN55379.1 DUF421 domain-containing protein [Hydrogenophaga sp.]NIO51714.1 DUF421 domain-containing protein [Hydrogenophaga sp.]